MAIEDTIASIDVTLKAILVCLQSGSAAVATLGTPDARPEATPEKKPRSKATTKPADGTESLLDGDEPGTLYLMTSDEKGFYKQLPGEDRPDVPHLMAGAVSAGYWKMKKEAAEKNASGAAAPASKPAATEPTAPAQPAAASSTSPDFKEVVDRIQAFIKVGEPKGGRAGALALLQKFLPDLAADKQKIPQLEKLNKNAEIIAYIDAQLSDDPAPAADDDSDLF